MIGLQPGPAGADEHRVAAQRSVEDDDLCRAGVFEALPDATAVLDASGTIVAVNRAWRMFALDNGGSAEATGVGVNYLEVCERAAAGGCPEALEVVEGLRSVLSGATIESDHEYPCPSPSAGRWFNLRIVPLPGESGGAVVSHLNITRRKVSEQQLEHRATHDPLTGLANRLLFVERLRRALRARPDPRHPSGVGVIFVDLDGFKEVNDTFGHRAGDEVLTEAAHALRSTVRSGDTVARLGGDEFAVCAPRITAGDLEVLRRRLEASLDRPHRIHGCSVAVPGSVGSHLASSGESAGEALRLADRQMYELKRRRKETIPASPVSQGLRPGAERRAGPPRLAEASLDARSA